MDKRYYFGIDLGTTNSVIAVYDAITGSNYAITVGSSPLVESQVWKKENEEYFRVGEVFTTGEIRKICDVKSAIEKDIIYSCGESRLTAPEVSARVLGHLVENAEKQFGKVEDIVLTVPANFNHKQRVATLKAASLAGIKVKSLINEPTSAALAYMEEITTPENILIYDLGGGTFDISLVNIMPRIDAIKLSKWDINLEAVDNQIATVIASDGMVNLGGNDIDRLALRLATARHGVTKDLSSVQDYLDKVKRFKADTKAVDEKIVTKDKEDILILRSDIEQATEIVFAETNRLMQDIVRRYSTIPISRIVLVGGSTKSKVIRELIQKEYPNIPICLNINPDECVALGAAKNNYIMSGETNTSFYDVVSGTYGTAVINEKKEARMVKMIPKGSPIPVVKSVILSKSSEEQDELIIDIYQGESLKVEQNSSIGFIKLSDIRDVDINEELVCMFNINSSGMLFVTTKYNGEEKVLQINTNELSEQEEDDAIMNAFMDITDEF